MDDIAAKILNELQSDFPLESRPYKKLAVTLGIEEKEVLDILKKYKSEGHIRRFGGVFDSAELGYKGTLCSMKVPVDRIQEVADVVNEYCEVTHNYIRTDVFNMWFTITACSEERIQDIIKQIKTKTKIHEFIRLDSKKPFKVKVSFNVGGVSNEE